MQKICRRSRRSCKAVCKIQRSEKNAITIETLKIKQGVNREETGTGLNLESSTIRENGKIQFVYSRNASNIAMRRFKKSLEGRIVVWYNKEDKGEWTIWNWSKQKSAWKSCAP